MSYPRLPIRFKYINHEVRMKMYQRMFETYLRVNGKPDLILAHSTAYGAGGVAAFRLAKKHQIPYVIMEHASAFQNNQFTQSEKKDIASAFDSADAILAVSDSLKSQLIKFGVTKSIKVLPNTYDASLFNKDLYQPIDKTSDIIEFCAIGYLLPVKGYDLLLKAFSSLKGDNLRLKIIGDGPQRENLKALAKKLNIEQKVTFTGLLSREAVARALHGSDCFVSASRSETFGVVYIEALAMGKFVIGTLCGGPNDIIKAPYGVLVPTEDKGSLSEAMSQFIENTQDENAHKRTEYVKQNFSPAIVAKKLIEVFENVIK